MPQKGYFKVAFVFGAKATDKIIESGVNQKTNAKLMNARIYAEDNGIGIDVRDTTVISDLIHLVNITPEH